MTIKLKSTPDMRDVILTKDGALKLSITSPTPDDWPVGTASWLKFTGRGEEQYGEIEADIFGRLISYRVQPDDDNRLNTIPRGANAELFISLPEEGGEEFTYKYQVGRVVRLEADYPDSPLNVDSYTAKTFSGDYPSTASLDDYMTRGNTKIRILGNGGSLPNGLGPNFNLFFTNAACLYKAPLAGDSISFAFQIVTGTGKTRFVICSNYEMTNYLCVELESGVFNNRIWIGTGSSPLNITYRTPALANTYANMDTYRLTYNFLTNTVAVYKGLSLTPLVTWEDENGLVQHGEGHRYFGFSWLGSLLDDGIQPVGWVVRDDP